MRCQLVLAALVLAACTPAQAPVDWQSVRQQDRIADEAQMDALLANRDYYFSDGEVALTYKRSFALVLEAPQLFVDATDSGGRRTPFIIDTGAMETAISASAAIARDVRVSPKGRIQTTGYVIRGWWGYLPSLRIGTLVGPALPVVVSERAHARHAPSNILGIQPLWHTQLEHRGGRWTLRSGSSRLPASEPGWTRVPLEQGTQVVRLTGPDGRVVYGMIDTGATDSFVVPPTPQGNYRLFAEDGRVALVVPADDDVHWKSMRMGKYDISVVIGMDVLASREWRLTFDEMVWALIPNRPR